MHCRFVQKLFLAYGTMIWAYLTLLQVLSMAFRTRVQSNQVMPLSNHGIDNDDSADITDSSSGALETRTGPKRRLGRIESILLTCYIYYFEQVSLEQKLFY